MYVCMFVSLDISVLVHACVYVCMKCFMVIFVLFKRNISYPINTNQQAKNIKVVVYMGFIGNKCLLINSSILRVTCVDKLMCIVNIGKQIIH